MSQLDSFRLAPKFLIGELVPPPPLSQVIHLTGKQQPTNIWKVLRPGPGFEHFSDIQVGDHVIPEKENVIVLDKRRLSLIHETRIFGVCPSMQNQVDTLKLAPKYLLAKRIEGKKKTEAGIIIPESKKAPVEMDSSFWSVIRLGPGFTTFATLKFGDEVAPERHVPVTLDRERYAIILEDWLFGYVPAGT